MKIAIIGGTGKEAHGLALRLARRGHEIIIGSRQQAKAERVAEELNRALDDRSVRGLENLPAAAAAELAILTIPYAGHTLIISGIAQALAGKVVIDTTVPVDPKNFRQLARRSELSAAEEAQQILGSTASVVAAFQNISAHALHDPSASIDCDVLVCGDQREAKVKVIDLIAGIDMRGLDAGPLNMTRVVEEMTPLLLSLNRRYGSKQAGIRITGLQRSSQ